MRKSSPGLIWMLSALRFLAIACLLGALLQGCRADCESYEGEEYTYGAEDSSACPAGSSTISDAERCECAAYKLLNYGWDGEMSKSQRPKGCYRYGNYAAWNFHHTGGTSSDARPICWVRSSPAPTPPAPTPPPVKVPSSCCEKLAGGRRLDGPQCTEEDCNR
eukprot:TRINITY_DN117268_c0_g1_i1.p1 TRINITY_DN117268_c0_g1~~TRINITY_DN117268_c0_g1_i1.p1  ORF type:complete len:163 (-),score=27.88 TRINITY_DN117268_c0_g1_i1:65-553(-)